MIGTDQVVRDILAESGIEVQDGPDGSLVAYYPYRTCTVTDIAFLFWRRASHMKFRLSPIFGAQYGGDFMGVCIEWDEQV
jgi:hypothetical protein